MRKILFVFGTRPEAIKMAPIILELNKHPDQFDVKVCVTAQHREMLDQVLKWFEIRPDYDLDLMKPGQDLFDVTANVLTSIKGIYREVKPDLVLVQGDTTTVMSAAVAAFYEGIEIGHIEAGLRTGDLHNPFPEEFNRKVASIVTKYHFAPTKSAKSNLIKENINKNDMYVTGNTVIDALIYSHEKVKNMDFSKLDEVIDKKRRYVLITAHRRESFGEGFINICKAILELAKEYEDVDFIYPVHLNPNVQNPVKEILGNISNVKLIEPLGYPEFVYLMSSSYMILTDSGGVQEEAPSLGKPVLVMRNTTERPEAIKAGTVKLVGTSMQYIIENVSSLLDNSDLYRQMSNAVNPYGDGIASKRIKNILAYEDYGEFE